MAVSRCRPPPIVWTRDRWALHKRMLARAVTQNFHYYAPGDHLMPEEFQLDLRGRLRNFVLPASSALVPVFEAVMNGLHAIREAERAGPKGLIVVEIHRRGQATFTDIEAGVSEPIEAFVIRDNGIGFNADNYNSFCTSDTQKKAKIGGRGVGRLTWVKAFEEVVIESDYRAGETELRRRRFKFTVDGIAEMTDERAPEEVSQTGTSVSLRRMKDAYYRQLAKGGETIAQRMVDHFLVALREKEARVIVEDGDQTHDVTKDIAAVLRTAKKKSFRLAGEDFTLTYVKVVSNDVRGHRVAYLADERQVKTEQIHNHIPQLGKAKLLDEEGTAFWSLTLVESPLLDKVVSTERDTFHFPEEADSLELEAQGQLTMDRLRSAVVERVVKELETYLTPLRKKALEQAQAYVQHAAPQYRHLLKAKRDDVEALPPDLSEEKLDVELRRIAFRHEEKLRESASAVLRDGTVDAQAYQELVSEANAAAIGDLAKYVRDRRVILNLLRQAVRRAPDGKYALEEAIHKLVLPMRTTSDDVPIDQMNLWLIDERLAFHAYLASDKPFTSIEQVASESTQRPDIIVFNRAMAFSDDTPPRLQTVVIVEFKRPMRDDYDEKENPIAQVYEYIREVRKGIAKQRDGRPFQVSEHVPFYCYIVCDLTPKLRQFAEDHALTRAWDDQGYFGYNATRHAYVEIISFDKLIDDAEKRNRVFFERLGLPRVT